MFPLFLNLANRLALVVGGGVVGRRKAKALLDAGANVRLVCLEARPVDQNDSKLEWLQEPYRPEHLDGVSLAFAAADSEVNRHVAADARRLGVWVNVADDPKGSDVLVPAVLRRGELTIAVGTGGASPGLAQAVRDCLEDQIDNAFERLVTLLAELRPLVLDRIKDEAARKALFRKLRQPLWLDRLRREQLESVREAMLKEIQSAEVRFRGVSE